MQYKITIPRPCQQNWDRMIPDETGRYCNSCKKSVIDFTDKTDEAIQQFIIDHFDQPVCGRFKNSQVHRIVVELPDNILSIQMPLWKRFLVACLLIFGISIFPFETTIAGKVPVASSYYQGEPVAAKTEKRPRILHKKKRIKLRRSRDILMGIEFHEGQVMGYMPTRAPFPTDVFVLDAAAAISYAFSVQPGADNKSVPHKEQPSPAPALPTEFILPAILSIRKENNPNTMDS